MTQICVLPCTRNIIFSQNVKQDTEYHCSLNWCLFGRYQSLWGKLGISEKQSSKYLYIQKEITGVLEY